LRHRQRLPGQHGKSAKHMVATSGASRPGASGTSVRGASGVPGVSAGGASATPPSGVIEVVVEPQPAASARRAARGAARVRGMGGVGSTGRSGGRGGAALVVLRTFSKDYGVAPADVFAVPDRTSVLPRPAA